jgi:hypothetical protein
VSTFCDLICDPNTTSWQWLRKVQTCCTNNEIKCCQQTVNTTSYWREHIGLSGCRWQGDGQELRNLRPSLGVLSATKEQHKRWSTVYIRGKFKSKLQNAHIARQLRCVPSHLSQWPDNCKNFGQKTGLGEKYFLFTPVYSFSPKHMSTRQTFGTLHFTRAQQYVQVCLQSVQTFGMLHFTRARQYVQVCLQSVPHWPGAEILVPGCPNDDLL